MVLIFAVFISFLLAMLSKENAVTFLLIIPVLLYYFNKNTILQKGITWVALLAATVVFMYIRFAALGFISGNNDLQTELLNNPYLHATRSEKYATIMFTLWKYIQLLFFPHPLTHDYYPKQIPIINWGDYRAFIPFLIYIGLIIFGIWGFIKKNIYALGVIIYLACLSIASNLVFNVGTFMNERFLFAASLGFCLIISCFLVRDIPGNKLIRITSRQTGIIIILILSLYSIKSFSRNFAWKDDYTLFTTDAITSPNSAKVNVSAGSALIEKANNEKIESNKTDLYKKAKEYLLKGIQIYPENIGAWVLLGSDFVYLEDYQQAIICFENCLKLSKTYPYAINNLNSLGQICFKQKKFDLSLQSFLTLHKYQGENADTYFWIGMCYSEKNLPDSALIFLGKAVKLDTSHYKAYNKIGEIYGKTMNDIKNSIYYLLKAHHINETDSQVIQNLGVAYGISGNYSESIAYINKAIKIDSTNYELYYNLGSSYLGLKEFAKAKECFSKAELLKTKPNR